jgi:CHAT domain-containing protein
VQLLDTDGAAARSQILDTIYTTEQQIGADEQDVDTPPDPVPLDKLQEDLRPSELFIEYVLAEPQSYALAVTRNSAHCFLLAPKDQLEEEATQYRSELTKGNTDLRLARRLFYGLLGGISEYRTKTDLILVPDGKLHLLPFAALADSGQYLAASHTVSVTPSGTVLDLLRHRNNGPAHPILPYIGVAAWISKPPPITLIASIRRAISGPDRRQLVALPESRNEVESIATDFPPPRTVLLGAQATETDFKRLPLGRYQVIHLALHGYADPEYPDRSALVFAPETPPIDDGLLQVREIRHLHLSAGLVTLSACDTGVGPVGEEGVADIGNAFIEAGAQSVVSALWEVNDQTTADLMIDFYRQLGRGKGKAAALRQAQLDMLKSGQPPSSWAGFELDGEPDGSLFQRIATNYSLRSSTQ